MNVILCENVENLGEMGTQVRVKDGYARNFLIPQGIAIPATEGNKKNVAEAKKIAERKEDKKIAEAKELSKKIEQIPCTIPVKVGEEEKIYGSVSAQEISDFLKKEGFDVQKRDVDLSEPIKQLGVYNIKINLYKDVSARLKVWVVKEEK